MKRIKNVVRAITRRRLVHNNDHKAIEKVKIIESVEGRDDITDPTESSSSRAMENLIQCIHKENEDNGCNYVHMESVASDTIEELYDGVHDGPVLGYGISGVVRQIVHKVTGANFAVKVLNLNIIQSEEGLLQLREEISILLSLDHPNIVKLDAVFEAEGKIYLIQELCRGGDLFDRLDSQPGEHYNEAQCARLIKQMLCAVRYIHSKGIIHRDLKLENFLFDHPGSDSELKMIDFGLSKHFHSGEVHHEPVGTRYTVAPEVLRGSYDEKVDIWAIGVITYLLLSGYAPFGGCNAQEENMFEVRRNILLGKFSFTPTAIWDNVSSEGKEFISTLLVVDPSRRPNAEECQRSEWVDKEKDKTAALSSNVISSLKSFQGFSDIRKLLCEVISFTLLPDQLSDLRKEFEKLDVEGTGEISLENLKHVLLSNAEMGSLGTLTDKQVEAIFNSMRLHKSDTNIRWHEFLAAGLSQCAVDERNHQLAFEHLDTDRKGYVTFDDFMNLVGNSSVRRKSSFERLWISELDGRETSSKMYYEEFKLFMENHIEEENEAIADVLRISSTKTKYKMSRFYR